VPLDIPDRTACFVDSNIFYYALTHTPGLSEPSQALMDRAIAGRISVSATIPVLSDTVHKIMAAEASRMVKRERAGIVGFMGHHPEIIGQLVEYPLALERLSVVPMNILSVDVELLRDATRIALQSHLMTNDALIVAVMRRHQLTHLITNDDDFDGVADLTVWKPR
jgi:predicted nucleic acid-binding protein